MFSTSKTISTRSESSMIHSASPQSQLAVIFTWIWSFGTGGQPVWKLWSLPTWSASWITIIPSQTVNIVLFIRFLFPHFKVQFWTPSCALVIRSNALILRKFCRVKMGEFAQFLLNCDCVHKQLIWHWKRSPIQRLTFYQTLQLFRNVRIIILQQQLC